MSSAPLYGGETRKAIENFPISGEPVPVSVIHWLARIKGASAEVNGELGLLRPALARRIAKAAASVAITSLTFMFDEVPDPVWHTTTSFRSTCSRPGRGPRRT